MQYGYFDNEKREYVIDNVALPCSWTNYLGVEDMAAVINHTAGGYLFYKTPEYHRISRFRGNGVPMDRPGFYVYIRDNEKKDYHSISWQPVAKDLSKAKYRCRHGLSYTVIFALVDGVRQSVAATDCLTPSTRANMTDWHPHRPWLFPAGKMYCCGM